MPLPLPRPPPCRLPPQPERPSSTETPGERTGRAAAAMPDSGSRARAAILTGPLPNRRGSRQRDARRRRVRPGRWRYGPARTRPRRPRRPAHRWCPRPAFRARASRRRFPARSVSAGERRATGPHRGGRRCRDRARRHSRGCPRAAAVRGMSHFGSAGSPPGIQPAVLVERRDAATSSKRRSVPTRRISFLPRPRARLRAGRRPAPAALRGSG